MNESLSESWLVVEGRIPFPQATILAVSSDTPFLFKRRGANVDRGPMGGPTLVRSPVKYDMEAFLISALAVAIGEFGDKTQLLAIMLAARLKQPLPIILGIAVATLANHTLAGLAGAWVRQHVAWTYLRWLLAGSLFAVALWALKPDTSDENEHPGSGRLGAFAVTVFAFFLAEIGDKTQIATVVLAARFDDLVAVVAGTTLGMLVADVPAVLLGHVVSQRVPFRALRWLAAALFALMGVAVIFTSGFD